MTKQTKNIATIRVKTDLENPIDVDIMAEAIVKVADNFNKAVNGKLTKRAIAILIKDSLPTQSGINMTDILMILDYMPSIIKYVKK